MEKGQEYTKEQALKLVEDCYDSGEPVFIIRGKDSVSSKALMKYAEVVKNSVGPGMHGTPTYNLAEDTERFAVQILYWQGENYDKIKLPD